MVVRQSDDRTQIAVLEDGVLVEHYVTKGSSTSMVGNVYLGRVQNVLPSMEAAFVDIGRGRNAVLYAGEVNWDAAGLDGQPKRIEFALKSGDPVLVQVTKDPAAPGWSSPSNPTPMGDPDSSSARSIGREESLDTPTGGPWRPSTHSSSLPWPDTSSSGPNHSPGCQAIRAYPTQSRRDVDAGERTDPLRAIRRS